MITVPISYSASMFDSNFYPTMLMPATLSTGGCTNRICQCTFNSAYSNSGSPTYTPASSPTSTVASLFAPSSPTFAPQPIDQSANLVSMLTSSTGSLSIGKFFYPNTSHLFNQHHYPTLFTHGSYSIPYACHTTGSAKRFIFTPGSWQQSYGMESVWLQEFSKLFTQFLPHSWYIMPVEDPPIPEDSLYSFFDSAKVRFCCEQCGHGWTSMKGRVAFWFDLTYNCGLLAFKLYGQTCEKCKNPDRYEQPMWYPEEVCKVLKNVFVKIGQIYYGYHQTAPLERGRRTGKPRTPHNSNLCQACKDKVCVYRNRN